MGRMDKLGGIIIKIDPSIRFIHTGKNPVDAVIEHPIAIERLIEKPAKVLPDHLAGGIDKIAAGGMFEAPARYIGAHHLQHFFLTEIIVQGAQHQPRPGIGIDGVAHIGIIIPGVAQHRIGIGEQQIDQALVFPVIDLNPQKIDKITPGAILVVHDLNFGVGVDPLIQPAFFEFVGGQQVVPVIVAELVDDHHFRKPHPFRHAVVGAGGNQGGIFHAAGAFRPAPGIDHGEVGIGIIAVPVLKILDRHPGRLHMAGALLAMIRLHQGANLHILGLALELQVFRAGGPGKIVHILGVIVMGSAAVVVNQGLPDLQSGRADNIGLGHGDPDVVNPVIGKKFRIEVKLVAVPAIFLQHPHLGKPLPHKEVFLLRPGAGKRRLGKFGGKIDIHRHAFPGLDHAGERHLQHGLIMNVLRIVRLDETHICSQIFSRDFQPGFRVGKLDIVRHRIATGRREQGHLIDLNKSPALPVDLIATVPAAGFDHESGAIVAEAVEVEVKLQFGGFVCGGVLPGQQLFSLDHFRLRIQAHIDIVVGDPRAERLLEQHRRFIKLLRLGCAKRYQQDP